MIEACDISKRYGDRTAVDGLSFVVRPGRVTGFLGPNGSGKSTTMRVILGLDAPTTGQALVNGQRYRSMRWPLHEVGALLDPNTAHGGRAGFNHLLWIARSNGIGRRRVHEVLDIVGIQQPSRRRVTGYSLGMRQRLGIAAALLGDPGVLLFDEPINGLDPEGIQWIRGVLKSLAAEGRTVFVSSHLMSEMALTAEHLILIGRGRLIADTTVADLVRSSPGGDVLVRTPHGDDLARLLTARQSLVVAEPDGGLAVTGLDAGAIGQLAAEHGLVIHELTTRYPSLEKAYLDIADDSVDYRGDAGWASVRKVQR